MNEFCRLKGIKGEFSVARTLQQNGVAERKNKTPIEAARTMLADSLLLTVFWAEAVNTACYVLNRVLVTKPHNKTPYELIIGRPLSISFMRPFGCSVTILNTLDPLGKFDGKGQGPNWLFDIDSLTNSMNYQPVTAGNQSNKNAGPRETNGNTASKNQQTLKNVLDKMMDQEKEAKEQSYTVRKEFEAQCNMHNLSGKTTRASSTYSFNTVSTPVNASSTPGTSNDVGPSFVPLGGSFPDNPLMPDLEDTAEVQNTGIFGSAYQEPTKIAQALDDKSWVEAMQEELLQFKIQKVWTLVDLLYGKKAIGTKWVYRNKKNERGIVMDVKSAFLYGTIEEEVYVRQPPAWYETLSTYLPDNEFYRGQIDKTLFIKRVKGDILLVQVYVDDIIFGSTKKSLCTDFEQIMHKRFQMSSMGELTFFLGLQVKQKEDGIFISQDKYVGEILKKFGFSSIRTASTPMETNKALTKDEDGEDVDVHLYRSMIGSLMYLTSSRPDIMFSVCACSRFQVQPKVSHLNAVKRIFRYLKGRPNLGLWYPKDSPFILEAFSDSDYAGASLDRKSTTGGCQFLGSRLISWQCKKQTVVANSTTEAKYITKIHVGNESAICVVKNPVYHSKTKHIEIRHHFIRDSYEKRLIKMVKIHTDNYVADLLTKAFDGRLMVFKCSGVYISAIWIEVGMDYNWSERVLEKPIKPPLSEGNTSGSGEGRMEHQFELMSNVPITPYDSPLPGGYTPRSDEGRLKLQELMTMCTKLSKQMIDLEKEKEEIQTG
ncbi:putative ribonuclease H-like domain-containing protein [Tanacetum coccineum]